MDRYKTIGGIHSHGAANGITRHGRVSLCVVQRNPPDDQPFTAPIITPLLKYFCRNGYNTSNGNV
ncbi:hypothetical protein, partial [Bifidobacterium longum]|uniref:hypothetical protein n=1 Tax=Bifidobacterium longum TaxID=216816 RepID=UPI002023F5A3